jgi:hypothetical protein
LQIREMWSAGPGDDQARFLADLRSLRDVAAIGYDELSARAHFPSDVLKEAENGPLLPGLPVLTAYVRACEGNVLDWEERWRRLAEVPEDPSLPIRPPGASPAAQAGARAGVSVSPPEGYDSERIKAALRSGGSQGRSDFESRGASVSAQTSASEFSDVKSSGWDTGGGYNGDISQANGAGRGWDTEPDWDSLADQTITIANGNHSAKQENRGPFDAGTTETAEPVEQNDPFGWLPEDEPAAAAASTEFSWSDAGLADVGPAESADAGAAEPWQAGSGPGSVGSGVDAAESHTDVWTPRQQDSGLKASEREDFWTTPVTPVSADVELPTAPPYRTEEQTTALSSRSTPPPMPAAASVLSAEAAPGSGSATATRAKSAAATSSTSPTHHEKDRFFPARLLVIIIIAALIGSALVLLLR